jgi:hypothetical protein
MDITELAESLNIRKVADVFESVQRQLSLRSPNSADNHGKDGIRNMLCLALYGYQRGIYPKEETFEELRARDQKKYEIQIRELLKAKADFGASI